MNCSPCPRFCQVSMFIKIRLCLGKSYLIRHCLWKTYLIMPSTSPILSPGRRDSFHHQLEQVSERGSCTIQTRYSTWMRFNKSCTLGNPVAFATLEFSHFYEWFSIRKNHQPSFSSLSIFAFFQYIWDTYFRKVKVKL